MNNWIQHVKQVQRDHNCSYKDALKLASQTYGKGAFSNAFTNNIKLKKGEGVYSKGLIYNPNKDYSKYFIKGMPTPKNIIPKGGKIKGKGFNWGNVLNVVDKIGNTAGNVVSSALGKEMGGVPLPNPYSMGRDIGENYLGPALKKRINKIQGAI